MNNHSQQGFSLIEIMIAISISLLLSLAVIGVYMAQTQIYKTSTSQSMIQSGNNVIANIVSSFIRGAGFMGCSTIGSAMSNLNSGGPNPLGSINTTPSMLQGYNGGSSSITLTANAANSGSAGDWSPALDASLVGMVEKGSDVLIILGANPSASPIGITNNASGSSFNVVSTTGIVAGQYGVISDCSKTVLFRITAVTPTTITHASGAGALNNTTSSFPVGFPIGSQFMPMEQNAFFVAQGQGGQSTLMRATLNGTAWTVQPLVPGVDVMKVQYGIGANGVVTQYVPANAVTNWSQVYSVRLGFLIEGQAASGISNNTQFNVLDTVVTVPADNRIRHVFEMTIYLRNSS